jgi:hypothetical protein
MRGVSECRDSVQGYYNHKSLVPHKVKIWVKKKKSLGVGTEADFELYSI